MASDHSHMVGQDYGNNFGYKIAYNSLTRDFQTGIKKHTYTNLYTHVKYVVFLFRFLFLMSLVDGIMCHSISLFHYCI